MTHRSGNESRWQFPVLIPIVLAMLAALILPSSSAVARIPDPPQIVLDGQRLPVSPAPFIEQGRTLIPLRAVFEAMGAAVVWSQQDRSITVTRDGRWVRLWIGRYTVCLTEGCTRTVAIDVPAKIVGDRTFVPLRFVAEAMGAAVHWDNSTRTILINSNTDHGTPPADPGTGQPASGIRFVSPVPGATITGPQTLQLELGRAVPGVSEVRYLLLDPATGKGPVIARTNEPTAPVTWKPDPAYDGDRIIMAAFYNQNGQLLAQQGVEVKVSVKPVVTLRGITPGTAIQGTTKLQADTSFLATHLKYELVDPASGKATLITDAGDPYGEVSWTPVYTDNGTRLIRVTAFDRKGRQHTAVDVPVTVNVQRSARLTGVTGGATLNRPVTLGVAANFPVQATRYILRDLKTGNTKLLSEQRQAGSFRWFPGPDLAGQYEVFAEAIGTDGHSLTTDPVTVNIPGNEIVFITTAGPGQVLAGEVQLAAEANVPLREYQFQLIDPRTGSATTIASGTSAGATHSWQPGAFDAGDRRLRVVAVTTSGKTIRSEELPVRVHTGELYGPRPVVAKDAFIDFVAGMAVHSRQQTQMSAALQIAQAILETGWGQSVPVDKYTGKMSNNLFGIKGKGPAGSVTSNTWEEYNGVVYRIDADFRAYNDTKESWADHKQLLLTADRYAPFRAVMHEPLQGAWALRRAGYATDSRYPVKLIDIMNRYQLYRFDETAP